jgi:hypothetical protein
MKEVWKNIQYRGFDNYQVSNTGRIKNKGRVIVNAAGNYQRIPERELNPRTNKIEPHLFVELSNTVAGVKMRKTVYVHRVVMEHFGKAPIIRRDKYQQYVEHLDGDYSNNRIDNLRWITWGQLYRKQIKNGRVERMDLYKSSPIWQKSQKEVV